jgi:hypothetical protein
MRRDSFERFYYEKIALGEGCGCAEHVTRTRELDDLAARIAASRTGGTRHSFAWLATLVRRFTSGKSARS